MSGEATWLTAMVFAFGALGIALLAVIGVSLGINRRAVKRSVPCPVHGKTYAGVVLTDVIDGHPIDIVNCARFEDPDHITCKKACLRTMASEPTLHQLRSAA